MPHLSAQEFITTTRLSHTSSLTVAGWLSFGGDSTQVFLQVLKNRRHTWNHHHLPITPSLITMVFIYQILRLLMGLALFYNLYLLDKYFIYASIFELIP